MQNETAQESDALEQLDERLRRQSCRAAHSPDPARLVWKRGKIQLYRYPSQAAQRQPFTLCDGAMAGH